MFEQDDVVDIGAELVSSDPKLKKQGWENFYSSLPDLRGRKEAGSLQLLSEIHKIITTTAVPEEFPKFVREDMEMALFSLDRPDSEEVVSAFIQPYERYLKQASQNKYSIPQTYAELRALYAETARSVHPTTINLNPQIPGHLRSYGTRMIEGYPGEIVYASHTNVFAGMDYEFAFALSGGNMAPPPAYYGLSVGLDRTYDKFGQTYDQMPIASRTQVLQREAWFQLLGTRVLHPFWDGNGRGFGGYLAVALDELGISTNPEAIESLVARLSPLTDRFLMTMLNDANLPLVKDEWHLLLFISPSIRQDYMTKLAGSIDRAIEAGISSSSPYFPLIEQAAQVIGNSAQESPNHFYF
jgi:hypothetical protein